MFPKTHIRRLVESRAVLDGGERGFSLVSALLFLTVLTLLAASAVIISGTDIKISSNYASGKQAFFLAEAGLERARQLLKTNMQSGSTLSSLLDSAKGSNGTLTDSGVLSNFTNTDDTPFINTTSLGAGSYQVYLTNDSVDGVTSTTDTNGVVTLTSLGTGPNGSQAVVQATVGKLIDMPDLPGAISLPGPNVLFAGGSSNASGYAGGTSHPAVAVDNSTSLTTTVNAIHGPPDRSTCYTGTGGSPSVVETSFPDPWGNVQKLKDAYDTLRSVADYVLDGNGTDASVDLSGKIAVINGDFTISGNHSGSGILVVTGKLTLCGNFSYNGLILVMGKGELLRNGGGNGTINGGIFVANISGADGDISTTADNAFGSPDFNTNGGGNTDIWFDSSVLDDSKDLMGLAKTSWRTL